MHDISTIAAALVRAALGEADDPKKFLRHHAPKLEPKPVVEYELEDIGIDNCQYFQGRGLFGNHRQWEAVFTGVGDNPAESIDDALDQAAMSGWDVTGISPNWPEQPSVADEYPDSEDLYYYTAVYLRKRKSTAESLLNAIVEGENPKKALQAIKNRSFHGWPRREEIKWRPWTGHWGRKGHMARALIRRHRYWQPDDPGYLYHLPRTYLHRHNVDPERDTPDYGPQAHHSVRYGNDHIVEYDRDGNIRIDHWNSGAARERINHYLHSGWHIMTWYGRAYWWNDEWPENIRDRLHYDMRNRKNNKFPWWIPVSSSDYLTRNGELVFNGGRGLALPDGSIKLGTHDWPNLVKPGPGMMRPWRRGAGRRGYDPRQLQMNLESIYFSKLDWIKRVRGKHEKMREVAKRKRELENIDKPDKRKKHFNLH